MKTVLTYALATCAAAGVLMYVALRGSSPDVVGSTATPLPAAVSAPKASATVAPAPAHALPVASQARTPSTPSKSAQVDALLHDGAASSAYAAYKMLWKCNWVRNPPTPTIGIVIHSRAEIDALCGDMSPGQIASRTVALERAAEAGVHGAWSQYGLEEYLQEPADQEEHHYQAAMERYLHVAEAHGDPSAMLALAQEAEKKGDPGTALKLLLASRELWPANDPDLDGGWSPNQAREQQERLLRKLNAQQAKAAAEAAKQLVAQFK